MKARNWILGLFLAATMVSAATDVLAQYRGGIPDGRGLPGGGSRGSRGGSGDTSRDQRPPVEQRPGLQEDAVSLSEFRLEMLRADLKLAPEQEASWKAFADKVSALAADISRERGRLQAITQMKALQRIDQSVDVARNRLTALEDIASVAKALYGRLTTEQQSIADARLATTLPTVTAAGAAGFSGPRDRPQPPQ